MKNNRKLLKYENKTQQNLNNDFEDSSLASSMSNESPPRKIHNRRSQFKISLFKPESRFTPTVLEASPKFTQLTSNQYYEGSGNSLTHQMIRKSMGNNNKKFENQVSLFSVKIL